MLLYYITDRAQFPGDEADRRRQLLQKVAEASRCGVDYIQLREKDLSTRELETLADEAVRAVRAAVSTDLGRTPKLLINSRTDVALACGADGVHLRSSDTSPEEVRRVWREGARNAKHARSIPAIGVSCHTEAEVKSAGDHQADFVVFGPIFEKKTTPHAQPAGTGPLRQMCRYNVPVLAVGGITAANALECVKAGAAGIAAIRLFQENDIAQITRTLRGLV